MTDKTGEELLHERVDRLLLFVKDDLDMEILEGAKLLFDVGAMLALVVTVSDITKQQAVVQELGYILMLRVAQAMGGIIQESCETPPSKEWH